MDIDNEAELEKAVLRARAVLVERTNEFTSLLRETFDPMKPVRRNPIGGIVASMATGLLLGAGPAPSNSRKGTTQREPSPSRFGGLLWRSLSLVAPLLQEAAGRWASARHARADERSRS